MSAKTPPLRSDPRSAGLALPELDLNWTQRRDFKEAGRTWPGQAFRDLEREWYAKLAASGFDDIETTPARKGQNSYLKDHHIATTRKVRAATTTGAAEYGRLGARGFELAVYATLGDWYATLLAAVAGWPLTTTVRWLADRGVAAERVPSVATLTQLALDDGDMMDVGQQLDDPQGWEQFVYGAATQEDSSR